MFSIRLILSRSYNPWFNLSLEEYIFKNMPQKQNILFLWQNLNTVVIGRAQNAWKECNIHLMDKDNIRLARRNSGGGAVYHDLGNTCFTFMSTCSDYNKNISTQIVMDGLNRLGISPKISGRNDLIIKTNHGEYKFSGSAYQEKINRKLHHGTLLLHSDLNKLSRYLNPDNRKLTSKGINSVKSRVINLIELNPNINHMKMCQALTKSFFKFYNIKTEPEFFSIKNTYFLKGFLTQLNQQRKWDWNFGNTPQFLYQLDTRFDWGGVTLCFDITNGIISRSNIFTDSLYPEPLENLSKRLIGVPYIISNIQNCCDQWIKFWSPNNKTLLEFLNWLIKNII